LSTRESHCGGVLHASSGGKLRSGECPLGLFSVYDLRVIM
jgi:hypothetical protein